MQLKPVKKRFWTSLLWGFGIIIISMALGLWLTGYSYVYKTLIYTYPDIDDLNTFNTRMVSDSVPQPWPASADYNKAKLPDDLVRELLRTQSVAFLVIKNDSVAEELYWDQYRDNTVSNSFSVAKSIVGILTGIAIKDGLISENDAVGKYIPQFKTGDNAKLKIRHLLTMSSGLNWDESYNSLFSMTTEAYYGRQLKSLVTKLKVIEEPGKTFRYMSCNTVLLSLIISNVTGMTISDYASVKLWKPLGASQPAYWSLDQNEGLEKAYCCFYSTARDFAKIAKLYMNHGNWNGLQIVDSSYVKSSVTPNGCIDEKGNKIDYYGYQWWLLHRNGHEIFYARGILGQYIIAVPDENIIIVRFGKMRGEKTADNQYTDMITYVDDVLSVYGK